MEIHLFSLFAIKFEKRVGYLRLDPNSTGIWMIYHERVHQEFRRKVLERLV